MMLIVNALIFLVTFIIVFYLPGRLLLERWLDAPQPEEYLPLSAGLGVAVIGTLVTLVIGIVGMFRVDAVVTPIVMWVAGLACIAALGFTGTKPLLRPRSLFSRPTRLQGGLWALAFVGLLVFSVHYDDDLLREDGALLILASAMDVGIMGVHTHPSGEGPNIQPDLMGQSDSLVHPFCLLSGWDGEALGPGIIPGSFLPVFGGFGMRLTYALAGFLLPGLGFLLGRALFRREWAGWAVAVLLTFSPWSLEIRTFDKNFMANVFGTLALVLLFRPRPAVILAGIATGFFLALHHIELFVVPFILYYLYHLRREGTVSLGDLPRFLGAVAAGLSPCLIMHVLFPILHQGGLVENWFGRPPAPHSLFGFEFDSPMLLNFPFIPELVRSPFHAFPPMLAYPLDFASRFGLVLIALVPAGAFYIIRTQPRRAVVLAAWFIPLMLVLMVQSNWVNPNKMGLPAMAAAPFVLMIVGGAVFLADRGRSLVAKVALAVIGLALPLAVVPALRAVDAPMDERVYKYLDDDDGMEVWDTLTHHLVETPEYVDLDREKLTMSIAPRSRADHEWRPSLLARSFGQFVQDLREPWLKDRRYAMPDFLRLSFWGFGLGIAPLRSLHAGDPTPCVDSYPHMSPVDEGDGEPGTVVWIDFNESPILSKRPLTLGPAGGDVRPLLEGMPPMAMVSTFDAAWAPGDGASLVAGRDRLGNVYILVAPGSPNPKGRPDWVTLDKRDASQYPDKRVPIRVPRDGVVRIIELRSYYPALWYSRYALVDDVAGDGRGEIRFTRGVALSPN